MNKDEKLRQAGLRNINAKKHIYHLYFNMKMNINEIVRETMYNRFYITKAIADLKPSKSEFIAIMKKNYDEFLKEYDNA